MKKGITICLLIAVSFTSIIYSQEKFNNKEIEFLQKIANNSSFNTIKKYMEENNYSYTEDYEDENCSGYSFNNKKDTCQLPIHLLKNLQLLFLRFQHYQFHFLNRL